MVSREYIVEVLNRIRNSVNIDDYVKDAVLVLKEYCLEHNKEEADIDKFIDTLIYAATNDTIPSPQYLINHYTYALEYYKIKFNIRELHQGSNIILYY